MAINPRSFAFSHILLALGVLISLSACDQVSGLLGAKQEEAAEDRPMTFAAAKYISTIPWFLAAEEGTFQRYNEAYKANITFEPGDYDSIVNRFVSGEIDVIQMSNVDAIAKLVARSIDSDVILIVSYSDGDQALLLPPDGSADLVGRSVALKKFSAAHYLLDRYLLKNQIGFDQVNVIDTPESDLYDALGKPDIAGVAVGNPLVEKIKTEKQAKVLLDSHAIPRELFDLLVVRREALDQAPHSAQALLATWFSIMERLQGNRKSATLDAMATLSEVNRVQFDKQWESIVPVDTPAKALSNLRDRRMKKTMRHLRYFIERYELSGNTVVSNWISYPGRTPALLHFNAKPLEEFVAPETEAAPNL